MASLERELRGESDSVEDVYDEIPDQYADLAARYDEEEPYDGEEQYDEDDLVAFDSAADEDRR